MNMVGLRVTAFLGLCLANLFACKPSADSGDAPSYASSVDSANTAQVENEGESDSFALADPACDKPGGDPTKNPNNVEVY